MRFEYDKNKSSSNKKKHGVDFVEAQDLWIDPLAIEIQARVVGNEERFVLIGLYNGCIWTAAFTYRDGCIRIISVRRARNDEKEVYYGK